MAPVHIIFFLGGGCIGVKFDSGNFGHNVDNRLSNRTIKTLKSLEMSFLWKILTETFQTVAKAHGLVRGGQTDLQVGSQAHAGRKI